MPCPGVGPCSVYDLDLSCCLVSGGLPDICLGDGTIVPQEVIDSSILAASQLLWALTGRQHGCCSVTINPCIQCPNDCPGLSSGSWDGFWGYPWYPIHQANGEWVNVSCPCVDSCVCGSCTLTLPYPVCAINEVVMNGVILDPTMYRVDDFYKIVLETSEATSGCWKGCDNSITLTYGRPVPELVLLAASQFACELIKNCMGRDCILPRRVSSITRQGVSVSFLDPMTFLKDGGTGIYLVDLAIMTYNPRHLQRRPTVYSPDVANKWRVTTWKAGDPSGCSSTGGAPGDDDCNIDGGGP